METNPVIKPVQLSRTCRICSFSPESWDGNLKEEHLLWSVECCCCLPMFNNMNLGRKEVLLKISLGIKCFFWPKIKCSTYCWWVTYTWECVHAWTTLEMQLCKDFQKFILDEQSELLKKGSYKYSCLFLILVFFFSFYEGKLQLGWTQ